MTKGVVGVVVLLAVAALGGAPAAHGATGNAASRRSNAIVAENAHRVVVMYAGQQVETGPVPEIFDAPRHPYTRALLAALPERNRDNARLKAIPGIVPGQHDRPDGCLLNPRCEFATERCRREQPPLAGPAGRRVRCHFPLDAGGRPTRGWVADSATTAIAR